MSTPFKPYEPKVGDEIVIDLFGLENNPSSATVTWVGNNAMVVNTGLNMQEYVRFGSDRVFDDTVEGYWRGCLKRSGDRIVALRRQEEQLMEHHKQIEGLWLQAYDKNPHDKTQTKG
jgi:hypothetical protein